MEEYDIEHHRRKSSREVARDNLRNLTNYSFVVLSSGSELVLGRVIEADRKAIRAMDGKPSREGYYFCAYNNGASPVFLPIGATEVKGRSVGLKSLEDKR